MATIAATRIQVGDTVMWRGGFGRDSAREAKVTSIEICPHKREKYGTPVDSIRFPDKDFGVFMLDNGHWAYGEQIDSVV
jgi:hypothetical protein